MDYQNKQMAILTIDECTALQKLSGSDIRVFLALCLHRNKSHISYPSIYTIAKIAGITRHSAIRCLAKIKEKKLITPAGKTQTGVIRYKVGGVTNQIPGGIDTDTGGVTNQIPGGIDTDTGGVSNQIPSTANRTTNLTTNINSTSTDDKNIEEKLFLLLWEKWQSANGWIHPNPLQGYRDSIKNCDGRDKINELQCIDLFLMHNTQSGRPIWSGTDFLPNALSNWFRSKTPSIKTKQTKYKPYLHRMITPPIIKQPEFKPREEPPKYLDRDVFKSLGLSSHLQNHIYAFSKLSAYEDRYNYINSNPIHIEPNDYTKLSRMTHDTITLFVDLYQMHREEP